MIKTGLFTAAIKTIQSHITDVMNI
jgi:hypothetical protein